MKYLGAITDDNDIVTKKYVDDATETTATYTSGVKIATVGGVDIYVPVYNGGVSGASQSPTRARP